DRIGTPQKIIDTAGDVVWEATYDSFGNVRITTAHIVNNLRFPGQYYDAETGLHYNLLRYYDPETGRYLRTDPFGQGLNLYTYCFNNPNKYIDPWGLCALSAIGRYLGTGFGEFATDYWANKFIDAEHWYSKAFYGFMGSLSALWTDETWVETTLTLASAGVLSLELRGAKTAAEAAEIALNAAIEEATGVGCFTAGTLIKTADGLRPIEEIEPGDFVLARDESTGQFEWREVVRTFVKHDQQILELEFENSEGKKEKINATIEHPFWVKQRGWIGASDLLPGDEVFSSNGGWLKLSGGVWLSERQTVYNFEVEGLHNYFVGEIGAWVHNNSMVKGAKRGPKPKGEGPHNKKIE
ncbi:MAG: hypothetical protein GY850_15690, partial [bacterium]|nr:hypothetical protein [bacterium]